MHYTHIADQCSQDAINAAAIGGTVPGYSATGNRQTAGIPDSSADKVLTGASTSIPTNKAPISVLPNFIIPSFYRSSFRT